MGWKPYFCNLVIIMRNNVTSNIRRFASCIIMMLALVWLTVSIPFVYQAQQVAKQQVSSAPQPGDEDTNPFANTTEERSESGANTLSEYLHDMHTHSSGEVIPEMYNKCHPSNLYYAFHPELLSPPPERWFA